MDNNESINVVKYENYKKQNERLKKALNMSFLVIGIFMVCTNLTTS